MIPVIAIFYVIKDISKFLKTVSTGMCYSFKSTKNGVEIKLKNENNKRIQNRETLRPRLRSRVT